LGVAVVAATAGDDRGDVNQSDSQFLVVVAISGPERV
jgi:hypothetical protein